MLNTNADPVGVGTIRKMLLRIVPFLFLCFVVAFLDRVNIGFAALTMNLDLGITKSQFGLISGIFFAGYFLFEIPSNLALRIVGGRILFSSMLIAWGLVAIFSGFIQSISQLYIARFLLGVCEAGFFPGVVLYLTYWFRRRERAQVLAMFIAAAPISGLIGSPLSGVILDHVHWMAVSSWRWLLILEGLPAIACGFATLLLLPSYPKDARFLTLAEQNWIMDELGREGQVQTTPHLSLSSRRYIYSRFWHLAGISFTFQIGAYAMYFWMPQAVRSLSAHYSNTTIGMVSTIPPLCGLISMILVSRSSDSKLERRYHAGVPLISAGIALILLGTTASPVLSMSLWSCVAMGISSFSAPFWSLPSEFFAGNSLAMSIALINSLGSIGGFVGPILLGMIEQRTANIHAGLGFAGIVLFLSATLLLLLPKCFNPTQEGNTGKLL